MTNRWRRLNSPTAEALSVRNVTYHLEKLEVAELIEVAGTRYSETGRGMNVWAPSAEPLVEVVGSDERVIGPSTLLKRPVGATGLLAVWMAQPISVNPLVRPGYITVRNQHRILAMSCCVTAPRWKRVGRATTAGAGRASRPRRAVRHSP